MNRPREVDVLDEPLCRKSSRYTLVVVVVALLSFVPAGIIVHAQSSSESRINASQSGFESPPVDPEAIFCKDQHIYCQDVGVAPERFKPILKMPPAIPQLPGFGGGGGSGISAKPHPHASFLMFAIDPFSVVLYGIECAAGDAGGCIDLGLALSAGDSGSGGPNMGQSGYPGTGGTAPCSQSAAGCGTGGGGGGGIGGVSCGNPPNCGPMPQVRKHTR